MYHLRVSNSLDTVYMSLLWILGNLIDQIWHIWLDKFSDWSEWLADGQSVTLLDYPQVGSNMSRFIQTFICGMHNKWPLWKLLSLQILILLSYFVWILESDFLDIQALLYPVLSFVALCLAFLQWKFAIVHSYLKDRLWVLIKTSSVRGF